MCVNRKCFSCLWCGYGSRKVFCFSVKISSYVFCIYLVNLNNEILLCRLINREIKCKVTSALKQALVRLLSCVYIILYVLGRPILTLEVCFALAGYTKLSKKRSTEAETQFLVKVGQ